MKKNHLPSFTTLYLRPFYKKNYPNADYVNFESLPKAKSLYLKYGAEQREKPVENETIFSNRSTELIIENRDSLMKWNIDTALEKIGSYLDNLHK